MFPTLVMGVLLSTTLYQIFRRADLSFISFLVLALISASKWCADLYLLRWINPLIPIYSSNFGNTHFLRTAEYSRLIWLILLSGTYIFSLIFIRSYGKGIISSAFFNMRKVYIPITKVGNISTANEWMYSPIEN